MDRYKYSVTPFSPIRDLIPGKSIRSPFSADLTKEEVFLCMKHGPVYRLFPGKDPIKVTGSNFESLHVSKYGEVDKKETPVVTKVEKKVVEEVPPVEEEIKIFDREDFRENVAAETTPVEEGVYETEKVEPVAEEIPVQIGEITEEPEWPEGPIEDSPAEDIVDSEDTPEEEETEEVEEGPEEASESAEHNAPKYNIPQYKPNYSKKNKKHKNHN